jgi:hypothetical protein
LEISELDRVRDCNVDCDKRPRRMQVKAKLKSINRQEPDRNQAAGHVSHGRRTRLTGRRHLKDAEFSKRRQNQEEKKKPEEESQAENEADLLTKVQCPSRRGAGVIEEEWPWVMCASP